MIKIKKKRLEKMINDDIESLLSESHVASSFCIHMENGVEVHVTVTQEEEDFMYERPERYVE